MKTGGSSFNKLTNDNLGYLGYTARPVGNKSINNKIMYSNSFNGFDKENFTSKGKKNKSRQEKKYDYKSIIFSCIFLSNILKILQIFDNNNCLGKYRDLLTVLVNLTWMIRNSTIFI